MKQRNQLQQYHCLNRFYLPVKQNLIQILFCSVALLLILFSPCIYTFLLEHAYSHWNIFQLAFVTTFLPL